MQAAKSPGIRGGCRGCCADGLTGLSGDAVLDPIDGHDVAFAVGLWGRRCRRLGLAGRDRGESRHRQRHQFVDEVTGFALGHGVETGPATELAVEANHRLVVAVGLTGEGHRFVVSGIGHDQPLGTELRCNEADLLGADGIAFPCSLGPLRLRRLLNRSLDRAILTTNGDSEHNCTFRQDPAALAELQPVSASRPAKSNAAGQRAKIKINWEFTIASIKVRLPYLWGVGLLRRF
jgi:hypothetical protein